MPEQALVLDGILLDSGFLIWRINLLNFLISQTNSLNVKDYEPSRIYCDRPSTRPGVYIGELPTDVADNYVSGAFYVVDEYQLYIQLLTYYPGECTSKCGLIKVIYIWRFYCILSTQIISKDS